MGFARFAIYCGEDPRYLYLRAALAPRFGSDHGKGVH